MLTEEKRKKVVSALIATPKRKEACKVLGITERTLYNYMKDEVLMDEYRKALNGLVKEAMKECVKNTIDKEKGEQKMPRTKEGTMVNINGVKLKEDIGGSFWNGEQLSRQVCGRGNNYLHNACSRNNINIEALKKVCWVLHTQPDDYIVEEVEEAEKTQQTSDALINVLENIYKAIKENTEATKKQTEVEESMKVMLGQINSTTNEQKEKVKAIFTDIHFDRNR